MKFYHYISFQLNNNAGGCITLSEEVDKDAINDDIKGENDAEMINFRFNYIDD